MGAQRTEEHTKIILDFIERFMVQSTTDDTVMYCKISDRDVASRLNTLYDGTELGGFFTESKVRHARVDHYGACRTVKKPAPATPAAPAAPAAPDPDIMLGMILSDLNEHRRNTADSLEDVQRKLDTITKIVLAVAKEWKVVL